MAIIIIPTPLRRFTNQEVRISVEGNTVDESIRNLVLKYPDLNKNLRQRRHQKSKSGKYTDQ
ncbi:MAG: hypothetical protein DDT31_01449 [Syntrophomonadaceae bacterium]|nr:hypothetical protein [Bacillota bacterium]